MSNILLVEDNPNNRAVFEMALRSRGHHVVVATDGQAALDALDDFTPEIILLDLSLPKIDGWTVAKTIRSDPARASIPIVALTAHAMKGDRERALAAGCDTYVSKPVSPRELARTVARWTAAA